MTRRPTIPRRQGIRGFTLVELMIAMLLGLVIVGSVMGVMLANQRTNRTNQGLTQVQETARSAFELLAHDLRQADGTGCGPSDRIANVVTPSTLWWQTWFGITAFDSTQTDPAVGFGSTAPNNRIAGTDSIRVESMDGTGLAVAQHANGSYRIDIDPAGTTPDFTTGDIMIVCDHDHATVFRASATSSSGGGFSVFHNTGGSPGNCSRGLGFPTSCASSTGNSYVFPRNSQVGRLAITDWYIGNNGRAAGESGRSLYRRRMNTGGALVTEEIVAGVTNMQLRFRATGSDTIIANPSLVADWSTISTVLITLTVQSGDATVTTTPGTNSGRIQRDFNYLVSLRNRLP